MNQHSQGKNPAAAGQGQSQTAEAKERRTPWWRLRARLILVPLDGSAEAKVALVAARKVAHIASASITIVYVSDEALSGEELLERVDLRREDTIGMVLEQVPGDPATAITHVAAQRHAMLIVMTISGKTTAQGWTISPILDTVLQTAPCPVLLLRPELAGRMEGVEKPSRLLLPLDGTPSSAAAIGPALDLANSTQAEVDILYVAGREPLPQEPGSFTAPFYVDQSQYEWPSWAQEFTSRFGTALGQVKSTTRTRVFLRSGGTAEEILRFATENQTDLIVLEWRGTADVQHRAVVRAVLEKMPCPVLLLQPPEKRHGWTADPHTA